MACRPSKRRGCRTAHGRYSVRHDSASPTHACCFLPAAGMLGRRRKDSYKELLSRDIMLRSKRSSNTQAPRVTPTLYTYRLVLDDGRAPNPHDVLTLTICKPVIRRTAQVGDIVAGVDDQHKISFVMVVTEKLTLEDYWDRANTQLQVKVPSSQADQPLRRFGDAIYDFKSSPTHVLQIGTLHSDADMDGDLSGIYALLSTQFVYAGAASLTLPSHLTAITEVGRGHRSKLNRDYVPAFQEWMSNTMVKSMPWGHIGVPPHKM